MSMGQQFTHGRGLHWRTASPHRRPPGWVGRALGLDLVLVVSTLAMAGIGAVMVYSATKSSLVSAGLDPRYYLKRDVLFLGIGTVAAGIIAFIDYHIVESHWRYAYVAVTFALLVVLLPHLGTKTLGAQRWFQIGPFQFQPSAFAALAVIVSIAALSSRNPGPMRWRTMAGVVSLAAVPMLLVAKQPDLGTAIIVGIAVVVMLAVAGCKARQLAALALLGAAGIFAVIHFGLLHAYQVNRLVNFIHQGQGSAASTYNLTQSKIDIGSGGVLGKGLFHDPQTNLSYVPEQKTDFIFAAVGGQLGFVGTTSVLALFGVIVARIWKAARNAPDQLGTVLCIGIFALITFSVFQNAGMTMGIMPITGIPLPLVSYGGSADIAFFAAIGLALNVGAQTTKVRA